MCWHMLGILELGRLRQKNLRSHGSLDYILSIYLKTNQKENRASGAFPSGWSRVVEIKEKKKKPPGIHWRLEDRKG